MSMLSSSLVSWCLYDYCRGASLAFDCVVGLSSSISLSSRSYISMLIICFFVSFERLICGLFLMTDLAFLEDCELDCSNEEELRELLLPDCSAALI